MKGTGLAILCLFGILLVSSIACSKENEPANLPDLVIDKITLSPSDSCYSPSFHWTLDVYIKNIGTADAGLFEFTLEYLHANATASYNFSGLAAGQEKTLHYQYLYFDEMIATVDAAAQVTESNESNNELAQTFMDPPPPTPCPSPTP